MSFVQYLRETKGELKHVSWPTRRQAIVFGVLVVILSILTAVYLGVFDHLFTLSIESIVR